MPISGICGRKPIQAGWLYFAVLPSLMIDCFGQGALVLSNPATIENSFYRKVSERLLLPLVALATAATVIASQAVITGAYSLTRQAGSSVCCRASRSASPPRRMPGRPICRASTRCC